MQIKKNSSVIDPEECRDQQKARIKLTNGLESKCIYSIEIQPTSFFIRNLKYKHYDNNNTSKIRLL